MAHNLKVTGSNPVPATKKHCNNKALQEKSCGVFLYRWAGSTIGQQNGATSAVPKVVTQGLSASASAVCAVTHNRVGPKLLDHSFAILNVTRLLGVEF